MPTLAKTEAEIQAERRNYIGGSEAAVAIGLSRYKTRLELWSEKTGAVAPADRSRALPVRMGHRMEEVVAELFSEETGLKVRRTSDHYYHEKFPFIRAQVDRRVLNVDAEILECKTAAGFKGREWADDEIPGEYLIQCFHQLAVTKMKRCHLACLIGGNQDFVKKVVERDEEAIDQIIRGEVDFWENYVIPKKMPPPAANDSAVLLALFPDAAEGKSVPLEDSVEGKIQRIKEIGTESAGEIQKLVEEKERLQNEIKAALGDASEGLVGQWRVTWKSQSTGTRLDLGRLRAESPETFKKYGTPGKTRVLRINEVKPKKGDQR